ncbi:MAG: hypothetical protein IH874_04435 [Candidatus Dadabacteria bacterium]|nr:hypothetical protein [Candidatus Dadabacteria bacterium]
MKVFCRTLMGEIGTTNTASGDIAIMVFTEERKMESYLKNWERYASVPAEVVHMELFDLFDWMLNKAPKLDAIAIDPEPDDDACPREVTIDRQLSYDLPMEEHFQSFLERFTKVMNSG